MKRASSRSAFLVPFVTALPLAFWSGCSSPAAGGDGEGDTRVPAYLGPVPSASSGDGNAGNTSAGLGGAAPVTSNGNGGSSESPVDPGSIDTSGSGGSTGTSPNDSAGSGGSAQPGAGGSGAGTEGERSLGCGLSAGVPQNPGVANTLLTFPPSYDGSTPFPLVFAFHGAGRTNEEMRLVDSRTQGSALEANYVVAYMKSQGNGWDIGADYPRFEVALEQITSERCIDTSRIFAFGHSSGAQFIVQMLGDNRTRETRFAGVVEVASSRFQNPPWEPLPTLVIHGLNDNQRGGDESGASDIVQYTQSNQCSGGTTPIAVPSCASLDGGVPVNAGCVEYVGCAAPTLFCNHDDPNYDGTNHGWPCFANQEIFEFFESVR